MTRIFILRFFSKRFPLDFLFSIIVRIVFFFLFLILFLIFYFLNNLAAIDDWKMSDCIMSIVNDVLAKRNFFFFFRFFFFFVSEMVAKLRIEVELYMINSRQWVNKKRVETIISLWWNEKWWDDIFFFFFFSWNRMPSFRD